MVDSWLLLTYKPPRGGGEAHFALAQAERRDVRARAGGAGERDRNEFLGQINYGFVPTRGIRFFPNVQYVMDPDPISIPATRGNIPDALVVGFRIDFLAGQFLAWESSSAGRGAGSASAGSIPGHFRGGLRACEVPQSYPFYRVNRL